MGERRVVVAGSLAQAHGRGGHAWVLLNHLLGFRQLGWEVFFLDRLTDGGDDPAAQLRYLADVMGAFGLERSYAVLDERGRCAVGDDDCLRDLLDRCELLLNVNGFLTDEDLLARPAMRAFLDIDPGFWQIWKELGLHDALVAHDRYVTIGENVGEPGCAVPAAGVEWIKTRQPIVLEEWTVAPPAFDAPLSSVAAWRGPFAPLEYGGQRYGLRVHEFRRFGDLPNTIDQSFEIALDIDAGDAADRELLERGGWSLRSPAAVAGDPWRYREYVRSSKAEIGIAKEMYVRSRSGWFSDRSVAYLASGRPVLAQDTGLSPTYRGGEGLLLFDDPAGARQRVAELNSDYAAHCVAAREIAERLFDAAVVLPELIRALGLDPLE
jgi:hypothetical protein